jgi:hypothetical protein
MEMEKHSTTEEIVSLPTGLGRYECSYDEFGRVSQRTYVMPDGERREYHFDMFGKLINEVSVSADGRQTMSEYIRNKHGRLIAKVNYVNGRQYKYIYDENGVPIGAIYTDNKGHRTLTEYIYNDRGECVNRIKTPM